MHLVVVERADGGRVHVVFCHFATFATAAERSNEYLGHLCVAQRQGLGAPCLGVGERRAPCWHDPDVGEQNRCATLSHMKVGVRELRNQTSQVIDAVRAGERVVLTVHGEAVADIVPHGQRARWLAGDHLWRELAERAADLALRDDLDSLAGQTLDEL